MWRIEFLAKMFANSHLIFSIRVQLNFSQFKVIWISQVWLKSVKIIIQTVVDKKIIHFICIINRLLNKLLDLFKNVRKLEMIFFTLKSFKFLKTNKQHAIMKKVLLGLIVFGAIMVLNTTNSLAQYEKGDKLLNLGVGLNSYYGGGIPLTGSFEVGVTEDISAGGSVSYLSGGGNYGYSVLYIGARASYHVNKLLNLNNDKVDLYGGLGLGYRNYSWKDSYGFGYDADYNGIYFGGFIGGRYYFKPNMAGFLELGAGGSSNANLGITFKF